jgi:uncharacterized protein (DUF779 family)
MGKLALINQLKHFFDEEVDVGIPGAGEEDGFTGSIEGTAAIIQADEFDFGSIAASGHEQFMVDVVSGRDHVTSLLVHAWRSGCLRRAQACINDPASLTVL